MNKPTNLLGFIFFLFYIFPSHPWEALLGFAMLFAIGIVAVMVIAFPLMWLGSILSTPFLLTVGFVQLFMRVIRGVLKGKDKKHGRR